MAPQFEKLHNRVINGVSVRGVLRMDNQGPVWETVCQLCKSTQSHPHDRLLNGSARCKSDSCPSNRLPIETSRVTVASVGAENEPTTVRQQAIRRQAEHDGEIVVDSNADADFEEFRQMALAGREKYGSQWYPIPFEEWKRKRRNGTAA